MIDANREKTVELPYTPRTAGKHLIELYADNARKIKIGEIEIKRERKYRNIINAKWF